MLHVMRADESGTFCGTITDSTPGDTCVVCVEIHQTIERVTKPLIAKVIKQYQRGMIGGWTLATTVYEIEAQAEESVLGVRS